MIKIRKGLRADELLKMAGRSQKHILSWPSKVVGKDDGGLIVQWEYEDCTVTLKRWNGCYRVAEIAENE